MKSIVSLERLRDFGKAMAAASVLLGLQACSNDNQPHNVTIYYEKAIHAGNVAKASTYLDLKDVSGTKVNADARTGEDLAEAKKQVEKCGPFKGVEVKSIERATSEDDLKAFSNFVIHYEKCDSHKRFKLIRTRDGWRIY